jgi:hypothetical protein
VTGQVVRIDLRPGTADIVNAGHSPPLRMRDGRVEPVSLQADPPFGTVPGHRYRVQRLPLEPGDRLVPRLAWRAGAGANDRLRRKRVRGERKSLAPIRFGVV